MWKHYDVPSILFSSNEEGEAWSEARAAKKKILQEQLEPLHEEVKALAQVYGPATEWLDGSRHTPEFVLVAINDHRDHAFQDLKYLWKKVSIGKALLGHEAVMGAATEHLKKRAFIEHQDSVVKKVEYAATSHFSCIEEALQGLSRVKCCADVDAVINKLVIDKDLYTGIPSVN